MHDVTVSEGSAFMRNNGQGPPSAKVLLHLDVFEEMRNIQRMQEQSPRFDLRDLTSSALRLVLGRPDAARLILDKAQLDFAHRFEKKSTE